MAYISTSAPLSTRSAANATGVCRIIGLVCVAGFIFDFLIFSLPPNPGNLEWRIGVIQQISERSIILLFGLGLLIYSSASSSRSTTKLVARMSMVIGIVFFLLCLLSVADGLKLQQQTVTTISTQESQLQTQIQAAQSNPSSLPENVNLEDLKQASALLTQQADTLRQNAKSTVLKTIINSIGNLILAGLGLLGLGRAGMLLLRSRA